jgi:3-oxoacyl-(acyl-carrier-protein) synthase
VKLCVDHAGLQRPPAEPDRSGIALGTRYGCLGTMGIYTDRVKKRGVRFATPLMFTHAFANTPASLLSIDYQLKGYHATLTSGEASGTAALATAAVALQAGHADAMLAGGVEALCQELIEGHRQDLAPVDDPDAYDPWAGDGLLLGEGGAFLLLERQADAEARGATIHALLRYGLGIEAEGSDLVVLSNGQRTAQHATRGCAPSGLYGECFGAAGALATAVAIAGLQQNTLPPVRGGGTSLEERREPAELHGASRAVVCDGGADGLRVEVRLP